MFVLVNLKAYPCDPVAVAEAARAVADDTGVTRVRFQVDEDEHTRRRWPGGK